MSGRTLWLLTGSLVSGNVSITTVECPVGQIEYLGRWSVSECSGREGFRKGGRREGDGMVGQRSREKERERERERDLTEK